MPIPHSFIIVKGQPKAHRRITGRFFDPLKMADMIIMNGIKTL